MNDTSNRLWLGNEGGQTVRRLSAKLWASGTALRRMEELAHQVLPKGISFEWTELAYQQQ